MLFYKLHFVLAITLLSTAACDNRKQDMAQTLMEQYHMDLNAEHHGEDGYLLPAYAYSGLLVCGLGSVSIDVITQNNWQNMNKQSFSLAILSDETPFWAEWQNFQYGYIFYPPLNTPKKMIPIELICAFPFNAYTEERNTNHGCTSADAKIARKAGQFCHKMGIHDFTSWSNHFMDVKSQCPFYMGDKKHAHKRFNTVAEANRWVEDRYNYNYRGNEVLAKAYSKTHLEQMPIQAIFMKYENEANFQVQEMQDRLKDATGKKVPIVKIRFPSLTKPNIIVENYSPPKKNQGISRFFHSFGLRKSFKRMIDRISAKFH